MKIAILSDIHANLQALKAVLEDCKKQGVGEYWLLGDYIDYGANPIECLELLSALNAKYAVGGNHDAGLFGYTAKINDDYVDYTREIYKQNPQDFEWLKKTAKIESEAIYTRNEPVVISDKKAIINPDSVGQPRNGSTKANYAILDGDVIIFRRGTYDIAGAVEEIKKPVMTTGMGCDLLWGNKRLFAYVKLLNTAM
jgi:predicted phosphodiesterase